MASVNAYLNFDGDCAAAFDFYRSAFGGEFRMKTTFGEMPGMEVPPHQKEKIMHVALPIGAHSVLMGSDWSEHVGGKMVRGNASSLAIQADSKAEAEKLFQALSAGGQVSMPLMDAPWGAYFGMFTDRFGIQWMVNCDQK
jgi:PhnB protein